MPAWEHKHYRLPGGALPLSTPAMLRQRAGGRSPAAEAVLCAMVESTQVDFDNALRIESRYFVKPPSIQCTEKAVFHSERRFFNDLRDFSKSRCNVVIFHAICSHQLHFVMDFADSGIPIVTCLVSKLL
jgi:predicted acyltransferase (DUF342 family)